MHAYKQMIAATLHVSVQVTHSALAKTEPVVMAQLVERMDHDIHYKKCQYVDHKQ